MFKRPATLKTTTPLRSSDRRKLLQELTNPSNNSSSSTFPSLTNLSISHSQQFKSLFPNEFTTAKGRTHLDEDFVLYSTSSSSNGSSLGATKEEEPLLFRIDAPTTTKTTARNRNAKGGSGTGSNISITTELIPTIYVLQKFPTLLPTLVTPPLVIPKLLSGADLFAPGIIRELGSFSSQNGGTGTEGGGDALKLVNGGLVAVLDSNEMKIRAVGRMAENGLELLKDEDSQGRVVEILHVQDDWLWQQGPGKEPEPLVLEIKQENDGDVVTTTERLDEILSGEPSLPPSSSAPLALASSSESKPQTLTTSDVNHLLRLALLRAIQDLTLSKNQQSTIDLFPMPASAFFSSRVLPSRPILPLKDSLLPPTTSSSEENSSRSLLSSNDVSPTLSSQADIKKSGYKKLGDFLKGVGVKEELLMIKELKGGEMLVMSVEGEHPDVQALRKFTTLSIFQQQQSSTSATTTSNGTTSQGQVSGSSMTNGGAGGDELKIEEVWKVPKSALAVGAKGAVMEDGEGEKNSWEKVLGESYKTHLFTSQELRHSLETYISSNSSNSTQPTNFSHPTDRSLVRLDLTLLELLPLNSNTNSTGSGTGNDKGKSSSTRRNKAPPPSINSTSAWPELGGTGGGGGGNSSKAHQAVKGGAKGEETEEFIKRGDMVSRLKLTMEGWYLMKWKSGKEELKKALLPLKLEVKKRQGKKLVTILTGFEPFFLSGEEIKERLKILCASSTTVGPIPTSSPKKPLYEITVQGDHTKRVSEWLIGEKGIPKGWIEGGVGTAATATTTAMKKGGGGGGGGGKKK